jgi:hypothetical protein
MLVGEIIDLIAKLSIGLDSPTVDDRSIYLSYLNLAHFELYKKVAAVNTRIAIQRDILNVTNGVVDPLTKDMFNIRSVYRNDINFQLKPYSFDKIQTRDPSLIYTGQPTYWYYINNQLTVWPLFTQTVENGGIGVVYDLQPLPFDLDDNSDLSIYYPVPYHPVLIDGASYYMFQSETGFRTESKMNSMMTRWETGKNNLYNYLRVSGGKSTYSTYNGR